MQWQHRLGDSIAEFGSCFDCADQLLTGWQVLPQHKMRVGVRCDEMCQRVVNSMRQLEHGLMWIFNRLLNIDQGAARVTQTAGELWKGNLVAD